MNNENIEEIPEITVPTDMQYYSYGVSNEFMSSLNVIFNPNLGQLSRYIDISNLEGITFTLEDYYEDAINSIERGFPVLNRIIPSQDGAAMTLALKRDSNIKCHIVFNINKWNFKEENGKNLLTNHTLSVIAHEMVHVEIMNNLHKYKPNICFPKQSTLKEGKGWETSKLCIEEFGACKRTYIIDDQNITLKIFEILLIQYLNKINVNQMVFINELKNEINNNINYYDACCNYAKKSYENYGRLLIISSYYLGSKENSIECHINIKGHELFKYIEELLILLNEAYKNYPSWHDSNFSDIQNLLEEILINEAKINFKTNIFGTDYFTVNL